MNIRFRDLCALAMLAGASCSDSHTPACPPEEPPVDAELPRCAARAADEWADGPADGRSVLVPESAHLGPTGAYVDIIFVTGDPSAELAVRRTFRLGLTDGTLTPVGHESITGAWLRDRLEQIEAEGGLEALLVCLPLPDGRDLRLVPSRPSETSPDPAVFYAPAFGRAVRTRDASGVVESLPLWGPDESTEEGRMCAARLVWTRDTRFVQCLDHEPLTQCAWLCPGLTLREPWHCTGRADDGLAYCEPP